MVAFGKKHSRPDDRPPAHILAWCRAHVARRRDGAIWGIPRSGTTFKIDHKNKQLVLVLPGEDDGADFRATKHVFSYIGWNVVTAENAAAKKPSQAEGDTA